MIQSIQLFRFDQTSMHSYVLCRCICVFQIQFYNIRRFLGLPLQSSYRTVLLQEPFELLFFFFWLKQQKCIFSQFWKLEVPDQFCFRLTSHALSFQGMLSPGVLTGPFPYSCASSAVSFSYKDTKSYWIRALPL